MTKIINFLGAPSAGKSFNAMSLTCALKSKGFKAEYVSEYAKDLVNENSTHKLKHQIYVFAKQLKRLEVLMDKDLDYIITDSPLILSSFYGTYYKNSSAIFEQLVLESFNQYSNINFFLTRTLEYDAKLRVQTEEESIKVHETLTSYLEAKNIQYTSLYNDKYTISKILELIEVLP